MHAETQTQCLFRLASRPQRFILFSAYAILVRADYSSGHRSSNTVLRLIIRSKPAYLIMTCPFIHILIIIV
jgi:hypothetical protein